MDRANDWSRAMGLSGQVHFVYASANVQLGNLLQSYPGEVDLITVQVASLPSCAAYCLLPLCQASLRVDGKPSNVQYVKVSSCLPCYLNVSTARRSFDLLP